jgi:hypothetical protein
MKFLTRKEIHEDTDVYKGGLSKDVYESFEFQGYIKRGMVFGYIGSSNRSESRDRIVEEELRATGLKGEGIASWMTSTDGRHLMDDPPHKLEAFREYVRKYVGNAFKKVVVWSHPDHTGKYSDTLELHKKIFGNDYRD